MKSKIISQYKTPAKYRDIFLQTYNALALVRTHSERSTNCAMLTKKPKLLFTKWSIEVEIWQNLETKHNTDDDFSPPYTNKFVGAENNKWGIRKGL